MAGFDKGVMYHSYFIKDLMEPDEVSMKGGCRFTERGVEVYDVAKGEWEPMASAYEWVNKRTRPAKPNNKTMKYRVITDILESIDKGDLLKKSRYKSDIFIHRPTKKKFTLDSLLRNPDWFEAVEEVQEGDWVYVVSASGGAYGANGHVGKVMGKDSTIDNGLTNGIKVQIYNVGMQSGIWGLGESANLRKATTDEIEQVLKKEAKRRGLAPGNKVKTPSGFEYTLSGNPYEYKYKADLDRLYSSGVLIYDNGEWAQIVDQTPNIEINGYEAVFKDGFIEFGCATINVGLIKDLYRTIKSHHENNEELGGGCKKVKAVKIGRRTFTLEDIRKIAEHYD